MKGTVPGECGPVAGQDSRLRWRREGYDIGAPRSLSVGPRLGIGPEYNFKIMQPKIEYNQHGQFRIVLGEEKGEWETYESVATLCVGKAKYMAFSSYWHGTGCFSFDEAVFLVNECK